MAEHVVPTRTYYLVFAALIALTGLTLWLATLELGEWHALVGLLIAATKAALVILIFMHVLYSTQLTWVVALSGLAWLTILIALTLSDYLSRNWLTGQGP
jgi:cytochrome c oxidase subunit 4